MKKNRIIGTTSFILVFFILIINIFFVSVSLHKNNLLGTNNSTDNIEDYSIYKESQSGNDVNYKVHYKESNVWFWDAKKSDFSPPDWKQREWDKWEYSTLPQFSLIFVGDIGEEEPIPPAPQYSGWSSRGPIGDEYTYTWEEKYTKAKMPKIKKRGDWKVTSQDDFDQYWFQKSAWDQYWGILLLSQHRFGLIDCFFVELAGKTGFCLCRQAS